jgi:uncharacterized membrane protein YphA (DoxX/SURF4 family)
MGQLPLTPCISPWARPADLHNVGRRVIFSFEFAIPSENHPIAGYEHGMTVVRTAARAMLAAIFVSSGVDAIINPERLAPKAKPVTDRVAPLLRRTSPLLPTEAVPLVQINGAVQVVAGAMLLSPARRVAAVALAVSLIPTTAAGHPFWQYTDRDERAGHRVNFLKNLGLLGGLVLAALDTEGRPGLRWRAVHLAHDTNASIRRAARTTKSKAYIARRAAAMGRHIPG